MKGYFAPSVESNVDDNNVSKHKSQISGERVALEYVLPVRTPVRTRTCTQVPVPVSEIYVPCVPVPGLQYCKKVCESMFVLQTLPVLVPIPYQVTCTPSIAILKIHVCVYTLCAATELVMPATPVRARKDKYLSIFDIYPWYTCHVCHSSSMLLQCCNTLYYSSTPRV